MGRLASRNAYANVGRNVAMAVVRASEGGNVPGDRRGGLNNVIIIIRSTEYRNQPKGRDC